MSPQVALLKDTLEPVQGFVSFVEDPVDKDTYVEGLIALSDVREKIDAPARDLLEFAKASGDDKLQWQVSLL